MSDVTLAQLATLPDVVQNHASILSDLQNENAALRAQVAIHEDRIIEIAGKWAALATAFQPPAVTRPLMAIPKT